MTNRLQSWGSLPKEVGLGLSMKARSFSDNIAYLEWLVEHQARDMV